MPDPRFYFTTAPIRASDALRAAGAVSAASVETFLTHATSIETANDGGAVCFAAGAAPGDRLRTKRFGLCFVEEGAEISTGELGGAVAYCRDPRLAFAIVASLLHRPRNLSDGGDAPSVDPAARVHSSALIGPGAVIGPHVQIGPNAVIGPGVVIGARSRIGANATVECALAGDDVQIGANSAIGGEGFGFVAGSSGLSRVPQLGRVLLADGVEVGAGACIDRGALGDTSIGAGTKIDNLVQIAHNVRIGGNCIIAAQVGIAGSTIVGDRARFGGQAGIADHLTIGDDARIAAKAGVMRSVPAGETWGGYPARPMTTWMRETAALAKAAERKKKKATDHDD